MLGWACSTQANLRLSQRFYFTVRANTLLKDGARFKDHAGGLRDCLASDLEFDCRIMDARRATP